ncbi:ceramide synthase-like [Cololabis saira]|uniref:ceramide synthase-like n=1 Tax=Cololabis saira TaxID=129043 RepID=UPI002AD4A5B7|nr:ceramide synthase-like [Cololabis saira]
MLALLAAGSVFFPRLFLVSRRTLTLLMGWRDGDAVLVSTRLVSSVQAVLASSAGFIITSSCRDVLEDRHWLAEAYVLFATPYFLYDIYAMFLCHCQRLQVKGHEEAEGGGVSARAAVWGFLRRESLMVLHHAAMVAVCFPASLLWRRGKGDYFQGALFLPELSTPSVSLLKILIQYKKQHTLLHKVNGVVMVITFFCCRVLLFPYLYYAYSRYASVPVHRVPLEAPWPLNLGAAVLWSLQLYWFALICRGALRQFSRRPDAPATASATTPATTPRDDDELVGGCSHEHAD